MSDMMYLFIGWGIGAGMGGLFLWAAWGDFRMKIRVLNHEINFQRNKVKYSTERIGYLKDRKQTTFINLGK